MENHGDGGKSVGESAGRANGEKSEKGANGGRLRREPMERMLRIHEYLAAGGYPNCGGLAREFEVSHKTVARDLG